MNLVVPEAKYPKAFGSQEGRAIQVMLSPPGMLTAIDLDDQAGFEADKIDNVTAHRDLPAKL